MGHMGKATAQWLFRQMVPGSIPGVSMQGWDKVLQDRGELLLVSGIPELGIPMV